MVPPMEQFVHKDGCPKYSPQKVAVADKKRRVKEDVLSALCYQAVFSQRCDTVGVA